MSEPGSVRKLYVLQLREGGISQASFGMLSDAEKAMLVAREGKYFLNPAYRAKIRVGLAGGVFDILHMGHIFTLNEARKHCDVLVVVVARDELVVSEKRKLVHSQEYRTAMVDFLKPVDAAILGGKSYDETLARVNPDVIVYGYDQKEFLKPEGVEIVKLEKHVAPEKFKSSRIIEALGL